MRTVEEHLAAVLALGERLAAVEVPVRAEAGVVLADDVVARLAVPPFDNSAMDGFAVRAADVASVPVTLEVVGDIPAGAASDVTPAPGQALRIMTGSPLPTGADAVVPVEDTDQPAGDVPLPARVEIRATAAPGRHVRRVAEDVAVGDVVLRAGAEATPAAAAAAASVGHGTWRVVPRPRALVVATGDELVAPGATAGLGRIPDSNGLLLDGLLRGFGADVVGVLRSGDDVAGFRTLLESAPDADLIVTSGGVSAGAFEVVRQATSGAVDFVKVAMQPGKPQGLGFWERPGAGFIRGWEKADRRQSPDEASSAPGEPSDVAAQGRRIPLLALPGNPVSVFVSAWLFVRPLVAKLAGRDPALPPTTLPALEGWTPPPGRRQYVPVQITPDGVRRAHKLGSGSHAIASLHLADGLAVVPAEAGSVAPGDELEVIRTHA